MSDSTPSTLLKLSDVTKAYTSDEIKTYALNQLSLEIHQGEFISIMGQSGSGKSTLLSILGLLEQMSDGVYELDGVNTRNLSQTECARLRNLHIGFVFQSYNLIPDLTILENVCLPLKFRKIAKQVREEKARKLLEKLGVAHRSGHFPQQLSGGEQQRVAIARALIGEPSILLADEPTGNLDSENSEKIMTILKELHQEGRTICMVTHDAAESEYASRKIKIGDGKIV